MSLERSILSITGDVTLTELHALVAVADLGTFRRAALELGYTQSALSHQVANLERKLGHELFSRPGGRGAVKLTGAGHAAYRRARRAIGEADAIRAEIEAAERGSRTRVRIGVSQTTASEIMPAALREFRELHAGVEVVLSAIDTDEQVIAELSRGGLELGFVHDLTPDDRVEMTAITEDPWVVLTRRDSEVAALPRFSFDDLDGLEVVAWTRRWRGQIALEEAWARRGIAPRIVYRTDDNLALQRLVAAGLGHACVGWLSARRAIDPALTWLVPTEHVAPRPVVLCHARRRELTATLAALVAAIRDQAPRPER